MQHATGESWGICRTRSADGRGPYQSSDYLMTNLKMRWISSIIKVEIHQVHSPH